MNMDKESVAKILLYLGAIALAGTIMRGMVLAHPLTTATTLLMMVPYIYIQFRRGMKQGQESTKTA